MQHQSRVASTDEMFGQAVARVRQGRKFSQREFAAALEREGMSVDASAVSRIENGTRSVRLPEATAIANALGVRLYDLLREPVVTNPSAELRQLRIEANVGLRRLGEELWSALISVWQVMDHLERHPELLREVDGQPSSVSEYLAGVTERLDVWPVSDEEVVSFRDDQIPDIESFMAKFVRLYLGRAVSAQESERLIQSDYSDGFNDNPV